MSSGLAAVGRLSRHILVFELLPSPVRRRIMMSHLRLDPCRAGPLLDSDEAVMPITTAIPEPTSAIPQPTPAVEYHYRANLLWIARGSPLPPGATQTPDGVNFVLLCRHGTAVSLI